MKKQTFPINLFTSLMLLSFIPFIYNIIQTNLIANIPSVDGFSISGHLEWFDLINETIQAFLIVPLYCLFNKVIDNKKDFKERISQTFLISTAVYTLFSLVVYFLCGNIVKSMATENLTQVTQYLRLETISFIFGNIVSFISVLFVVLSKSKYIYLTVVLKTIFTIVGDMLLIPMLGVNGVAITNIIVNLVIILLCLIVLKKEDLMVKPNLKFKKEFIKDYINIGLFSGSQILLDNIIYFAIVCKMVNAVNEQGNYWVANNIIWGLLLIPIMALAEIVKKDCKEHIDRNKLTQYFKITGITFVIWILFIPFLNLFLNKIMGITNFTDISTIIKLLIPFYFAYGLSTVFDSILVGKGKAYYLFGISIFVNLVYYPIMYLLVLNNVFTPTITFICWLFGIGNVVHLLCSVICYFIYKKTKEEILI